MFIYGLISGVDPGFSLDGRGRVGPTYQCRWEKWRGGKKMVQAKNMGVEEGGGGAALFASPPASANGFSKYFYKIVDNCSILLDKDWYQIWMPK